MKAVTQFIFFLLAAPTFLSCNKEEITKTVKAGETSSAVSKIQPPLAIGNSTKSMTILNANTGKPEKYYYEFYRKDFAQAPLFTDSLMIIFLINEVIAKNLNDGSIKWRDTLTTLTGRKNEYYISYPCINDRLVMFAFSKGRFFDEADGIYALNLSDGKIVWVYKDENTSANTIPAYANGILVINGDYQYGPGHLYAIDVNTGKLKWKIQDEGEIHPACIDNDKVYYVRVKEPHDSLFSLNLSDGSVNWSKKIADYSFFFSPLVSGDHVYINLVKTLLCLNKKTGKNLWKFSDSAAYWFASPYASNGTVFVNTNTYSNTYLYAINETDGKLLWKAPTDAGGSLNTFEGPVVMNNMVYLRDSTGSYIKAFNSETGEQIFAAPLHNHQVTNPDWSPIYIDANGKMVFSTASGMH